MGCSLKEALKAFCVGGAKTSHWSYAVFWKFGLQNPELLICEECYYGPVSCSGITSCHSDAPPPVSAQIPDFESGFPVGNEVCRLVDKMVIDSHVIVVGQGLVGHVAFTGNYWWILSENQHRGVYPPEILKDVSQLFSAGIQTTAVIPVLPLGVIQFGSYLRIPEDVGFVSDVISFLTQLGEVPGVMQPQNFVEKELIPKIEVPVFPEHSSLRELSMTNAGSFTGQLPYMLPGGIQNDLLSCVAAFEALNSSPCCFSPRGYDEVAGITESMKSDFTSPNQLMNGVAKAEDIISFGNCSQGSFIDSKCTGMPTNSAVASVSANDLKSSSSSKMVACFSDCVEQLAANSLDCSLNYEHQMTTTYEPIQRNVVDAHDIPLVQHGEHLNAASFTPLFPEDHGKWKMETSTHLVNEAGFDSKFIQSQTGDDLFDIPVADILFSRSWNSPLSNQYSTTQGNSDSGMVSSTGTDYLLDAVAVNAHPSVDQGLGDDFSCQTTFTNTSNSSVFPASLLCAQFGASNHAKGELLTIPKYLASTGSASSAGNRTTPSNDDFGAYSRSSSLYDSWVGNGSRETEQNNSVSTGYSRKPQETNKANRKRLKPGENPRPRPKDRQMIQDRLKELRELVPNGGKCSIDALLERTITHMLFLQSVEKHAQKLKLTAESNIISEDNCLLSKEGFEGGATWGYDMGSRSMVCPIIVKDLNQFRQLLVEMLCEEQALFLEIANILRGLGLTILKGVMDAQNDKIRARFTVEANQDITRMEIFFALVRHLEQNSNGRDAQPNNINIDSSTTLQQLD